ncbi:MAG TPA: hypothetical protein VLG28_04065 [Acidimicrobiia bacterium]|nr:hypothetical protein [Acidimicrobiia bacterium]
MPSFRHLVVFVIILLLLRRVTGVPISIVGSVVLTIVVSFIMGRFDRGG